MYVSAATTRWLACKRTPQTPAGGGAAADSSACCSPPSSRRFSGWSTSRPGSAGPYPSRPGSASKFAPGFSPLLLEGSASRPASAQRRLVPPVGSDAAMVYEQLVKEGGPLDEIADVLEGAAVRLGGCTRPASASSRAAGPFSRPGSASQRSGSAGGARPGASRNQPPSRPLSASASRT